LDCAARRDADAAPSLGAAFGRAGLAAGWLLARQPLSVPELTAAEMLQQIRDEAIAVAFWAKAGYD